MKIVMVASEATPLCKTGGLADVIGSLSKELTRMGHEVYPILPFYKRIKDRMGLTYQRLVSYDVQLSWRRQTADVFRTEINGISYYLIGNDYYFDRDSLYGYDDDGERFAFFTLAVRSFFGRLDVTPDIIHIHDWQPGMLPVLIKEQSADDPRFAHTRFVMTLHNEAFKGFLDRYFLNHFYGLDDRLFDEGAVRFDGMVSTLKAGIVYSDAIVAVSPSHAKELLCPGDAMRLDGVLGLRPERFYGIVNGVDEDEFDPLTDPLIPCNYGIKNVTGGKKACRSRLLSSCSLEEDDAPVFGVVTRLTYQKGIDILLRLAEELLPSGCKLIVLGAGEQELENAFEDLRSRYPTRCAIYRGYNNQLAHNIYAGSDFFLMPSLFEPCGIGQMIAQRYGSLPIVRYVGGLKDTIVGFNGSNADNANGFVFEDYTYDAFRDCVAKALTVFSAGTIMRRLITNAMKVDHSWRKSAQDYVKVYESLF